MVSRSNAIGWSSSHDLVHNENRAVRQRQQNSVNRSLYARYHYYKSSINQTTSNSNVDDNINLSQTFTSDNQENVNYRYVIKYHCLLIGHIVVTWLYWLSWFIFGSFVFFGLFRVHVGTCAIIHSIPCDDWDRGGVWLLEWGIQKLNSTSYRHRVQKWKIALKFDRI